MKSKKAICFIIVLVMMAALCPIGGVYASDPGLTEFVNVTRGSFDSGLTVSQGTLDVKGGTGSIGRTYALDDDPSGDGVVPDFELYYALGTTINLEVSTTGSVHDVYFYYETASPKTDTNREAPAKYNPSAIDEEADNHFTGYDKITSAGIFTIDDLVSGSNLYMVFVDESDHIEYVSPIWIWQVGEVVAQAGSGGKITISPSAVLNPANNAATVVTADTCPVLFDDGDDFTITVSANAGYRVNELYYNGSSQTDFANWATTGTAVTDIDPGDVHHIYASFAPIIPPSPPSGGDKPHAPSLVPTAPSSGSTPEQPAAPPPTVFDPPLTTESISLVTTFGQSTAVIDGETKTFPANYGSPYLSGSGNTMLPLRLFAESVGFEIEWNNAAWKIIITDADGDVCVLIPGQPYVYDAAGKAIGTLLDATGNPVSPVINSDDRTYLPMRAVLEQIFGIPKDKIVYDGTAQTVTVLE